MSWRMVDGKREGNVTVYENGVVDRSIAWDSFEKDAIREVLNDESGKRILIERSRNTGVIIYKGDYNCTTFDREGYGIEYDEISGIENYFGFYYEGVLLHIMQSFVNKSSLKSKARVFELSKRRNENDENGNQMIMIEFGGNEDEENNIDVINRHPIYMGGYRFDEKRNEYIRYGLGYELNEISGICDSIGEWDENGEKKKGSETKLYGGWYGEGEFDQSIRVSEIDENARKIREEEERKRMEEMQIRPFRDEGGKYGIIVRFENGVKMSISD